MRVIQRALTFDDVLLLPAHSRVLPREVSLKTRLTRTLELNIPLVSAAMDTVTEARLAIAIAQEGGIGIIHKNLTPEGQAAEAAKVKRFESGVLRDPVTVSPDITVRELLELTQKYKVSGFPVVEKGKVVGMVTNRDYRFETNLDAPVRAIMTPKDRLIYVREDASPEEAKALLHKHRLERVLVVNESFKLRGLITVKDILKSTEHPSACKDVQGKLRVGAAVGVGEGTEDRVDRLVEAGVDVIVVDTAHGHAQGVLDRVKWIKRRHPKVQVIGGNVATTAGAKALVDAGADGIKVLGGGAGGDPIYDPEILGAMLDEAKKQGLGSTTHLSQMGVARMNILDAARLGLRGMEHWYGLPEALFADRTVQDFPTDYNYNDEQNRFGEAGRLWKQAAPPGSAKWNAVQDELLKLHFTIDPTLTIYEASRDLMRAMRAEWHDKYTLPSLWKWYTPNRAAHGAYWFDWTTGDEIAWKNNYRIWMQFLNEYKNRGGRVCTGSDSGFIYKLYGFDYIRELELLQEAGFHPIEVIRAATLCGAETIAEPKGRPIESGIIRTGMLADLVLVEENPIHNLKVLYGTGAIHVNDQTGVVERVGGVKWVMKDGILYDAKGLLADVEKMVAAAKK